MDQPSSGSSTSAATTPTVDRTDSLCLLPNDAGLERNFGDAAVADIAYREGSIYHAAVNAATSELQPEFVLIAATIAMTTLLLAGLLYRQKDGVAGIGFESVRVILLYVGMLAVMAL